MNRKYGISSGILIVIILCAVIVSACRSGGNNAPAEDLPVSVPQDNSAVIKDVRQAKKIFDALPSPLESAMLIKSAGARFEQSLLNPVSNVNNYVTNKNMALNLGIYTCDLSYASLYDQTQLIIDYMNAAKKMADGLGILKAVDQATIDEL